MPEPGSDFLDFAPEGDDARTVREREAGYDEGDAWTFRLEGRPVTATLYDDGVVVRFTNGTTSQMTLPRLHFCPDCLRGGVFPFDEDAGVCGLHGARRLDYSRDEFERFELLAQLVH